VTEVVREGDLAIASGRDVSYVKDDVLGPISAQQHSRAVCVLTDFSSRPIDCADVIRLFKAEDVLFDRIHRDKVWWKVYSGKLRVRGWRSSHTQQVGQFGDWMAPPDAE